MSGDVSYLIQEASSGQLMILALFITDLHICDVICENPSHGGKLIFWVIGIICEKYSFHNFESSVWYKKLLMFKDYQKCMENEDFQISNCISHVKYAEQRSFFFPIGPTCSATCLNTQCKLCVKSEVFC